MAEISVIVPVYNTEKYLRRCVDSILAQTFTDFELILVDDGSTDGSGAICDAYSAKDKRVCVFHQDNQGQAAARNFALDWLFANSDSKYFSFVDSDDWVHAQFLELLQAGITRFHVNICQCRYLEINGIDVIPEITGSLECIASEEQYTKHYSAFMWDKLFSRSCWEEMRFPEGQVYEDVSIWYKILFREKEIGFVDSPLYFYYANPTSTVRRDWTPANLARIRAWDEQISFFRSYGNREVLISAVKYYCNIACLELHSIKASRKLDVKAKHANQTLVRRKLRRVFFQFPDYIKSFPQFLQYFEAAFPRAAWIYWSVIGKMTKYRSRKKKE